MSVGEQEHGTGVRRRRRISAKPSSHQCETLTSCGMFDSAATAASHSWPTALNYTQLEVIYEKRKTSDRTVFFLHHDAASLSEEC